MVQYMVHMVSNLCYTRYVIKRIWYVKYSVWNNKRVIWEKLFIYHITSERTVFKNKI